MVTTQAYSHLKVSLFVKEEVQWESLYDFHWLTKSKMDLTEQRH